ncbi:MAG: CvpA family protein [Synergistaceae bacterium]|jgi:membrane protein required for colicin V production|nr:CvpA family protein [Synergistaceae bacterium]
MNLTDIILLLTASYFIARGILKGFSGEALSLISVFGGAFCALRFHSPISLPLAKYLGLASTTADMVSIAGIFVFICFVCYIADICLKKALTTTNLTWMDKTFGAIAGFLKVYVIAMFLLVSGMLLAPFAGDRWIRESGVLIVTARTWPVVSPLLDRMGLLPDLTDLQQDAKDYVLKQAGRRLFGGEERQPAESGEGAETRQADEWEFPEYVTGSGKNKKNK